jgi:hypothetical protein
MDNKRKAILFFIAAGILAGSVAPIAANQSIRHILIVLPLVLMGVLLLFGGYYAGQARDKK